MQRLGIAIGYCSKAAGEPRKQFEDEDDDEDENDLSAEFRATDY